MTRDDLRFYVSEIATSKWDYKKLSLALLQRIEDEGVGTVEDKPKGTRTGQQNRAIHKDCALIAEKLNGAGLDMRVVLKPTYSLPWTTESVKEHLWRPFMRAMFKIESTTELAKGTGQIEAIHDMLMHELGEKHGIEWHDFPSDVPRQLEELGGYRTSAGKEYPEGIDEYTGPPAF